MALFIVHKSVSYLSKTFQGRVGNESISDNFNPAVRKFCVIRRPQEGEVNHAKENDTAAAAMADGIFSH
jgi:hypothetical protein